MQCENCDQHFKLEKEINELQNEIKKLTKKSSSSKNFYDVVNEQKNYDIEYFKKILHATTESKSFVFNYMTV
eukprot:Pgem_evm1s5071